MNDPALIEEKLKKVLSEVDISEKVQWDFPPFFSRILEFLMSLNMLFRILSLILVVALIVFILYKMTRLFLGNKKINTSPHQPLRIGDSGLNEASAEDYLYEAKIHAEAGQFAQAILLLHKGSVKYLLDRNILKRNRDYTNREIISLIKDERLSESFGRIAMKAEFIVFKGSSGDQLEYEEIELLFRSVFL
jgi:hypothetical protein